MYTGLEPGRRVPVSHSSNRLWAITSYFNPARYRRRFENYRVFRRHLTLPLLTVELGFDGRFELGSGDADRLVQVHGRDVMWQKERLLNIALAELPAECEAVAWLDCDLVFDDPRWPRKAMAELEKVTAVQPFDRVMEAGPSYDHDAADSPDLVHRGRSWASALNDPACPPDLLTREIRALGYSCGLAWAARRSFLERHGFYDACVMGSGVRALPGAVLGRFEDTIRYLRMGISRSKRCG